MGKLTIISPVPIFPVYSKVKKDDEKETEDGAVVKLTNILERGTNYTMNLKTEDDALVVDIIREKSDKNTEAYTVWGYQVPWDSVKMYQVDQYAPSDNRRGMSKIKIYLK